MPQKTTGNEKNYNNCMRPAFGIVCGNGTSDRAWQHQCGYSRRFQHLDRRRRLRKRKRLEQVVQRLLQAGILQELRPQRGDMDEHREDKGEHGGEHRGAWRRQRDIQPDNAAAASGEQRHAAHSRPYNNSRRDKRRLVS